MNNLPWVQLLAGLGGLAGLAALFNSLTKASASKLENLVTIIDAQAAHIALLDARLAKTERALDEARAEVQRLLTWIDRQGLDLPQGEP